MDQRKRLVFAERHKMYFVVGEDFLALGVEQDRAVVRRRVGIRAARPAYRPPLDHSGEKWMVKMNRQQRGAPGELRIFEREWRGRFRPHKKVGLMIGGRKT